jgi:hypothetical protein
VGDRWETGRIEAFSDGVFAIALLAPHGDEVPAGSS